MKTIPLGPNVKFNEKHTTVLWTDKKSDNFWFYQESSDQWYYYDVGRQEFFISYASPRNAKELKEISWKTFNHVRQWIKKHHETILGSIPDWPDTTPKIQEPDPWKNERKTNYGGF